MDEEKMSSEELVREIDIKMPGCGDINCRVCHQNERLIKELAKRLGVKDYKTAKQEQVDRMKNCLNCKWGNGTMDPPTEKDVHCHNCGSELEKWEAK